MTTFRRIFWKESRAQWQIWGGLLVIVLLSQGLFFSISLFDQVAKETVVSGLFGVAVVLSVCYAAASAAILVAGEREDETDFLLRTFPVPRSSLIGGKLAFTCASLLALLAIGSVSATFLSVSISGGTLRYPMDLANTLRSLGGAVAWGFFFSLLVDRVMVALGLAITTEIIVVGILGNFLPEAWWNPIYWTIVAAVLAVDLRMAARWLDGRPLFREASTFTGGAAGTRVVEPSTRWLRLLQRFVATGNPEWRATRALVWRELRGAVPFMAIWGIVGFVMVDLAMRWSGGLPMNFLYLHLTPAACGLMAVLGDQRRGTQRFFGDHGVAPLRVWSVKIGTWLIVAVVLTVFFGWYDVTIAGRLEQGRGWLNDAWPVLRGLTEVVRTPLMRIEGEQAPGTFVFHFALSVGLMLFAIGQWAGFLRGQPMVAGAITIGLGTVAIAWHYLMLAADVPLAMSTWPLIVILFGATAWGAAPWLIGQSTGRFELRDLWILVPVIAVLVGVRTWRITAIPIVPDSTVAPLSAPPSPWIFPTNSGGIRKDPLPTQVALNLQDPTLPLRSPASQTAEVYFSFRNPESASLVRSDLLRHRSAHVLTRLVEMAEALVPTSQEDEPRADDSDQSPSTSSVELNSAAIPPVEGSPANVPPIGAETGEGIAEDPARPERQVKKLDPATFPARWDGLCDLLAASEYSATLASSWDEWSRAVETRQKLQQSMRAWGRLEGQTSENLKRAIDDLLKTSLYVSPLPMLRQRGVLWRRNVGSGDTPWPSPSRPSFENLALRLLIAATGERERSIRLANALTSASLTRESRRLLDPDQISIVDDPLVEKQRRRLAGWSTSTFLVPPSAVADPMFHEVWAGVIDTQFHNQVAARAGTILCLLLQRYRLEHGTFPPDLATAAADLPVMDPDAKLLHDPFSGAEYQYRPNGFPAPLHVSWKNSPWQGAAPKVLPAKQPLLWSVGPGHSSIDAIPGPPPAYQATSRARSYFASISYNDVAREPKPDEVRFLILPP